MKKTLLVSEIFPPIHGGSGRWFWELYRRLPRDKFSIAAGACNGATDFDKTHDLQISRIPLSSFSWGFISVAGLKFYWKAFFSLRKLIKNQKIEALHCGRCLPEGVLGYLFNKLYGLPYICYIHGEDIETASTSRELSFIVNLALKNAHTLIANSKNTHSLLINKWHTKPEKTLILNPGYDAERFKPADFNLQTRQQLGWDNRPVILTVGRLQKRKGQDMLIQALPAIREKYSDVLYAIIGEGEEKPVLKQLAAKLGVENNVMFMSEISDEAMIDCYQQCSLFVLPNRTIGRDIEGFGMVLVEAQGCGKPVIAGDSGGTAETMIVGETGFIVDCTKPDALAEKIIALLENQDLANKMGQKGEAFVQQTLDWKAHTEKATKLFAKI